MIISSRIQWAFSMLYMISSSQTFSKYLSIVSTKLWINYKQAISLSYSRETPIMKYRLAYRLQMTLQPRYSMNEHRDSFLDRHLRTNQPQRVVLYLTVIQLQYLASLVWPCLLTMSKNLIIMLIIIRFNNKNLKDTQLYALLIDELNCAITAYQYSNFIDVYLIGMHKIWIKQHVQMISFLGGTWVLGSFIEKSMNIYIPGQNHLIFINFPFHFLNSIFHFLNFLVSYLFGL